MQFGIFVDDVITLKWDDRKQAEAVCKLANEGARINKSSHVYEVREAPPKPPFKLFP